jgi:hypothetical protein
MLMLVKMRFKEVVSAGDSLAVFCPCLRASLSSLAVFWATGLITHYYGTTGAAHNRLRSREGGAWIDVRVVRRGS